ncbi:MAG: 4Fe-4S binding protein, partial [Helicobacteraceae bacterium]|nr:4Fe-4S binding protein [Helicobacteraceae bacterium]
CAATYRHKKSRNRVLRTIENNCTGCKRCLKKCEHKALIAINVENGVRAIVDPDKCTGCGDCIRACKFNALELISRI